MSEFLAWHFVGATLRDGRRVPADGVWLRHDGPIVPRKSGLHASPRILDALTYAPGSTVCRVVLRGEVVEDDGDKIVGPERKILWRLDAASVLRAFARSCARDLLHLWDAPAIVREYLEGDETKRIAARDAARDTSGYAAWAAWVVARDAAMAAGMAAARAASAAARVAREAAREAQNDRLERMIREAAGKMEDGQ